MNVSTQITPTAPSFSKQTPRAQVMCERLDNFGPKPQMCWLPKASLRIDGRYQRSIETPKSKRLIEKLRDNWRWYHCSPLAVTDNGDDTYNVLDGQHRMAAALQLDGVGLLPCYVVDEMTLAEQAEAFVVINADRVHISPEAIFHASVIAGNPEAKSIVAACAAAGVSIHKSYWGQKVKHTEQNAAFTGAVGQLRRIYRSDGAEAITATLSVIREAHRTTPAQLSAIMMQTVHNALKAGAPRAPLVAAVASTTNEALHAEANQLRITNRTMKQIVAYGAALANRLEKAIRGEALPVAQYAGVVSKVRIGEAVAQFECEQCNESFEARIYDRERGRARWCSRACVNAAQKGRTRTLKKKKA